MLNVAKRSDFIFLQITPIHMMCTERKAAAREHRTRNFWIMSLLPYHCTNFVCNLKEFCNIVGLMLLKNYQPKTDRYQIYRSYFRVRRVLAVN